MMTKAKDFWQWIVAAVVAGVLLWYLVPTWAGDEHLIVTATLGWGRVHVTAKNRGQVPLELTDCTFFFDLKGVRQPLYEPCLSTVVKLAPGQKLSESARVFRPFDHPTVTVRYRIPPDQTEHLVRVPLR